jgi:hypothetical protein
VGFPELFLGMKLIDVIVEKTDRHIKQSLHSHKLSGRSIAGARKGEMYVVLAFFMLIGVVQKSTLQSLQKGQFSQ